MGSSGLVDGVWGGVLMAGYFEIVLPIFILIGGAFAVFLLGRLFAFSNRVMSVLTAAVLAGTLVVLILNYQNIPHIINRPDVFYGLDDPGGIIYRPNAVGVFILIIGVIIGLLITLYSGEYLSRDPRYLVYYPLILLTLAGLLGMFTSNNLFNLFLLTELTTITASALVAFRFKSKPSIRAGFKYLIMSSLGTMTMMLGIYFVYRSTGDMQLVAPLATPDDLTRIGAACFLLGFSLKAGVVPLHTWVPDVYGHAPSAVSGLLAAVLSKSMLFIMPVVCLRLGMTRGELGTYLMIFANLNMLVGSVRMLRQQQLGRFLSFSTIAQTGYLMFGLGMGFYYGLEQAYGVGLFLFMIIAVMKCLAFLSAGMYEYYFGTQDIELLRGAGRQMPLAAFTFSIALAGLAGIPLLAGFNGKWLIFSTAILSGDVFALVCLAVFVLSTVIGLGGYLPMIVKQYQPAPGSEHLTPAGGQPIEVSTWMVVPTGLLSLMVIVIGVYPGPWVNLVSQVMQWMMVTL
jgi:formate hydrogenlyase subunit 3/multisubunit Na+/H+ antiporter MnhD subunit